MRKLGFRGRLFLTLSLFALVPAIALTIMWGAAAQSVFELVSGEAGWDSVAVSGERALAAVRRTPLDSATAAALRTHETELASSVTQARRVRFLARRAVTAVAIVGIAGLAMLALVGSRVAGHLSRQLSRPVHELVGWTRLIAREQSLPAESARGAPEFAELREQMRAMAAQIEEGRARALEAERLRVFRETARRVAHELRNPLTPIRFAVARLKSSAPADLTDTLDVIDIESARLERLAHDFAQLGRLGEGPESDIDLGEVARQTIRAQVPDSMSAEVIVRDNVPLVHARHDAVARAVSNLVRNAVEASESAGTIEVEVQRAQLNGTGGVRLTVRDRGRGIAPADIDHIWDPYVTRKQGGTGLGLAIVRQTIEQHGGVVGASSAPNGPTEVHFTLPALRATNGDEHAGS